MYSISISLLSSLVISSSLCIVFASFPVVSVILLAALPVGAHNTYFLSKFSNISIIHFIIVVFPVPGPPVITVMLLFKDTEIASFCSSDNSMLLSLLTSSIYSA